MVNNKGYMETKARRETHSRDFGCCFHTTSPTCAFRIQLSTVSMYNFMTAYICIENIQVKLVADSIQKWASASIKHMSICIHRRHLGEWDWGRAWATLHALLYGRISNKNRIFPKTNYIIRKLYLLRGKKNLEIPVLGPLSLLHWSWAVHCGGEYGGALPLTSFLRG